jgi:hypothetical protein
MFSIAWGANLTFDRAELGLEHSLRPAQPVVDLKHREESGKGSDHASQPTLSNRCS